MSHSGLVLGLSMYLSAQPPAALLANPEAKPVFQAFSVVTVVTSLVQIHNALLRGNLRSFDIAIVTLGAVVGTVLVRIYDRWLPTLTLSLA
jgi:hypothetical protein